MHLRLDVPAVAPSVLPTHTQTHKHTRHATTCRPYWLVGAENVAANCCKLHIKTVKRPKPWGGQLTVFSIVACVCVCLRVCLWCVLCCSHFYFPVHSHSLSICRTLNSHILVAQVVKVLTGRPQPLLRIVGILIPYPNDSITLGATLASRKQTNNCIGVDIKLSVIDFVYQQTATPPLAIKPFLHAG